MPCNKLTLSRSCPCFCARCSCGPPAHTACQDGGVVAEDLRPPVQRREDDAVRALHSYLRRLQDNQREGARGSDRTG